MNNYEKIKAMSIDEMAETFNRKYCEECGYRDTPFSDDDWQYCSENCWAHPANKYYKQWLESEA